MTVCAFDGVAIAMSRVGRWVHLDDLPEDVLDHDVSPVHEQLYKEHVVAEASLRKASSDMLQHHGTLHPDGSCEWADRLRDALKNT